MTSCTRRGSSSRCVSLSFVFGSSPPSNHRAGHRGRPLRRADPAEAAGEVDRGEADGARGHPVRGGAEEQAQVDDGNGDDDVAR